MNSLSILLTGFLCAAPIDQCNIEIIRRSLSRDFHGALAIGLGALFGDSLLFLFYIVGFTKVLKYNLLFLPMSIFASLVLIVIGTNRVISNVKKNRVFFFSINPVIYGLLFSILDPTSGVGALAVAKFFRNIYIFESIFLYVLGSLLWLIVLLLFINLIEEYVSKKMIVILEKISGIFFIVLGLSIIRSVANDIILLFW